MEDAQKQMLSYVIAKLDIILSLIAALIQISLFLSYIKQVIPIEAAVSAGLAVAVAFLGIDSLRRRKLLKDSRKQEVLLKDFPVIISFLKAMESLPQKLKTDSQILYDEISTTYDIDGSDAVYTRETTGQNVSNEDLERIAYRFCGETSIENGRLPRTVSRKLEGNEVERVEPAVLWSTSNVKVLGVDLNPPIRPGGKFDVTFSTKWLGAFVSKYGYVFVSLSHCVKGVKKLVVNVNFKEKVSRCSIWTLNLRKHEMKELEKLKPKRHGNMYTIRWQRARPDTDTIYIFRYRRSSI